MEDTMQRDTDDGFWAYVEGHAEEFRIVQVINAYRFV